MSATTVATDASARELLELARSRPATPPAGPDEQRARDLVEQSLGNLTEHKLREAINAALLSKDSTGPERLMLMRSSYDLPTARYGLVCYRARLVLPKLAVRWAREARVEALKELYFGSGVTSDPQRSPLQAAAPVRVVDVNPTLTAAEAEALRVQLITMLASAHMLHQMWTSFKATRYESFIQVLKTELPATASPWQIERLHTALRIAGRKFIAMRDRMAEQ